MEENKLYNALNSSGYYTKSQADFESQFSTPEAQDRLYKALNESQFYTKSADDFRSQFFTEVKKKEEPVSVSSGSVSSAMPSAATPIVSDADNVAATLRDVPLSFILPHADKKVLDKSRHPLDMSGKASDDEMVAEKLPAQEDEVIAKDIKPQQDPSYFWGGVRAINSGTANFFKTLDNASRFVADVTGLPQHEGIFKKAENYLNEMNQTTPDVPDNRAGRLIRNVGGLEGLFLELAITPDFKIAKIGAVPKIVTQMTGAGFVNSYGDALTKDKPAVEKAIEGLKGAGVGLKDAAILTALGYTSSLAGGAVAKAAGSEVAGGVTAALTNAVGFAGSDAVQQLISTGQIDKNQIEQSFDVGLALGVPEIAKIIGTRAMANYFTSSKSTEKQSLEAKPDIETLRQDAIRTREESKQDDTDTRASKEAQANVIDGIADIKVISKEVAKDPDKFRESIKNDETLSEEQKQVFLQKIDDTVKLNKEVDASIASAQKRLNLPEEPELRISEETTNVMDGIKQNKPVLNDDIQKASSDLYDTYNRLEALKTSDKREYTLEQISKAQESIGTEITNLETYAAKQKESGMFVPDIEAEQKKADRKLEIENRITSIDDRKAAIDRESLSADEQTKKKLYEEFVSLNKERKQLNDELSGIGIKPIEPISTPVETSKVKEQANIQAEEISGFKQPKQEVPQEQIQPEVPQLTQQENGKENDAEGQRNGQGRQEVLTEPRQQQVPEAEQLVSGTLTKKQQLEAKTKEADRLLSEGLSDLADLVGAKISITGEQRVRVKQAIGKVAKGLTMKGEVAVEKLVQQIKEHFLKANIDISEDLINETLKEEGYAKRTGTETQKGSGKEKVVEGEEERLRVRSTPQDGMEAGKGEKVKEQAQKIIDSTTLPEDIKQEFAHEGITYIPRGKKVRTEEAEQIVSAKLKMDGGREQLKSDILDTTNGINGDARVVLARAFIEDSWKRSVTSKSEAERELFKKDAADILRWSVESSHLAGTVLEAQKEITEMLGRNPELIEFSYRGQIDNSNKEFFAKNDKNISTAQKIISDYLNSEEFKKKYKEIGREKITVKERKERGLNKIANAIDKLASLANTRKNFTDEEIKKGAGGVYDAIKELADGILDVGVASVEDMIIKLKINTRKYLTASQVDAISKDLISDTDAKNRIVTRKKRVEIDKTDESKLVTKLYGKLIDANEQQLRRLIADNIELLNKEGSISDESFRELFARAMGRPYADPKIIEELKKNAEIVLGVKIIEDDARKLFDQLKKLGDSKENKAEADKITAQINKKLAEHRRELFNAARASKKMGEVFAQENTIPSVLGANIKGNLMAISSQLTNIIGNYSMFGARVPKNAIALVLDRAISLYGKFNDTQRALLNKTKIDYVKRKSKELGIPEEEVVLPMSYYKAERLLNKLPESKPTRWGIGLSKYQFIGQYRGYKEGIKQLWTGALPEDIYKRDLNATLHPLDALYNDIQMLRGKEKMNVKKFATNLVEGLTSGAAEVTFRVLNLFDKPTRRGAEMERLAEIGNLMGLKDAELKELIEIPTEEQIKEGKIAGDIATFQQDTMVSKLLSKGDKWLLNKFNEGDAIENTTARIAYKTLWGGLYLIKTGFIPYHKTPINVIMEMLNYALPEVAIIRAIYSAAEGNRRGFTEHAGEALTGVMIRNALGYLFGAGIMTLGQGGSEDKDKKTVSPKIKAAEYRDKPAYSVNTDALLRDMSNKMFGTNLPITWQDGDVVRSYKPFGVFSAIAMAQAEVYKGKTPEEIRNMSSMSIDALAFWPAIKSASEQSFLKGTNTLFNGFFGDDYEYNKMVLSLSKSLKATVIPRYYTQYTEAQDNRIRDIRDRSIELEDGEYFWEKKSIMNQIKNDFKASLTTESGLIPKRTVWGEEVKRYSEEESIIGRLFDFTKKQKYKSDFGTKITNLYLNIKKEDVPEGKNKSDLLPPLLDPKIRYKEKDIVLTQQLYDDYQEYVGTMLKAKAKYVVNDSNWDEKTDKSKFKTLYKMWDGENSVRNRYMNHWKASHSDELNELYLKQINTKK